MKPCVSTAHSMFKKLAESALIDYQILDPKIEFDLDATGKKIQYYNVSSQYLDNFIARFGNYRQHFYSSYVSVDSSVPPHTDIVDRVNINFYIETGGYQTTFYQSRDHDSKWTYADHGDGHVYNMDSLEQIGSFVAQPGDVYVLNGKIIHGVSSAMAQPRKFLQVSANDLDYDQVLDILDSLC